MGILDRILGNDPPQQQPQQQPDPRQSGMRPAAPTSADAQALERYRYMIRSAPPETVEQAHAEAFARLTPEQRRAVLAQLADAAPPNERAAVQNVSPDDPRAMGRVATRAEIRQPGIMERMLGGGGMGGSLLGSFAMGFLGSMVAHSFFSSMDGMMGGESADAAGEPNGDLDHSEAANDVGVDDVGGGDFGGGDFGGGDF